MIRIILVHGHNITSQMIPGNEAERMCQDPSSNPNGQAQEWLWKGGWGGACWNIQPHVFIQALWKHPVFSPPADESANNISSSPQTNITH